MFSSHWYRHVHRCLCYINNGAHRNHSQQYKLKVSSIFLPNPKIFIKSASASVTKIFSVRSPRHYHRSIFGHLPTILLYPHSSKSGGSGGHILTRRQQLHSASLPKSMGFYVNKRYAKRHPRQPLIKWCKKLTYRTASKPVTALASFPGSGNTWLR